MKIAVGSLVTAPKTMYLDDPDTDAAGDLEFNHGEVGLVLSISPAKTASGFWVKVLTPKGVGVCFDGELTLLV